MFSKKKSDGTVSSGVDEKTLRHLDRVAVGRKLYNRFINCLDPMYSELIPMSGILVRSFVKDQDKTEGGVYIGELIRQQVEVATLQRGKGYIKDIVDDPFGFQDQCIVIAVPQGESTFVPGQVYACKRARVYAPVAMETTVFDYDFSFIHPSYMFMNPPTDVKDRHFGYMLISRDRLLMKMGHADVINTYKNFENEIDAVYEKGDK